MNKKELRKIYSEKRRSIPKEERDALSRKALSKLLDLDAYKNAKEIFTFVSFREEIDTKEAIGKFLEDKKTVLIPYIEKGENEMKLTRLKSLDSLEEGYFGVLEPRKEDLDFYPDKNLDLILVPGLLFDKRLYRLGYGGGFYDRFFSRLEGKPLRIGYCFSFQLVDYIPTDSYDLPVDMIITD